MEFADSRKHVGLQIVDVLTNGVRRALYGNLQREGWQPLRKLMINHRDRAVRFISLGSADSVLGRPYASVGRQLTGGRSMLAQRRR
jgi:hypothetical protein